MLLGVLKCFLLILSLTSVGHCARRVVSCTGDELSLHSNRDTLTLSEKRCTHVIGDIVIENLNNVELLPSRYERVSVVFGSIIIKDNKDVKPTIHFPRLRFVNSTLLPAIVLIGNTRVRFSVGDRFKRAVSMTLFPFAVLLNDEIISPAQYNLMYLAAKGAKVVFLTDIQFDSELCHEHFYKPLAGMLGFLFATIVVAFSTVAFYDRTN